MSKKYCRKAINFDLSTNELKKHFANTADAYNKIKDFMLENGFEHRQYSGYISKDKIDDETIIELATQLGDKCPWLSQCIVTEIGNEFSIKHLIKQGASQNKNLSLTKCNQSNEIKPKPANPLKAQNDYKSKDNDFKR